VSVVTQGVTIEGLPGAPPSIGLPGLTIPRGFTDAGSLRLGGELRVDVRGMPVDVRAGVSRDSSAVPRDYVSLLSLDADRITLSFGASIHLTDAWRLDALYAHQFIEDVTVSPDEARVARIDPLGGNVAPETINGGTYHQSGNLFGIGAEYRFR
jgi:long-chain fatty acid transport protein